jgi:hypothetical protein
MKKRQITELNYVLSKGPANILNDYFLMLEALHAMLQTAQLKVPQITRIAGITESQFHRRRNKPELWTKEEVIRLLTYLSMYE